MVFESLGRAVIGFGVNLSKTRIVVDEATLEDHEVSKLYFIGLRDELKDFRQETNRNFKDMAEKYGDILEELKEFRKTVKGFLDAFFRNTRKEQPTHRSTTDDRIALEIKRALKTKQLHELVT